MTDKMDKKVLKAMEALGWLYVQTGPDESEWRKFDSSGSPLAIQGDTIWTNDLASCEMAQGQKKVIEKQDIVRVLRILEYVGPREWVEACLEQRGVKDKKLLQNNAWISEAFLGRFPEPVVLGEEDDGQDK